MKKYVKIACFILTEMYPAEPKNLTYIQRAPYRCIYIPNRVYNIVSKRVLFSKIWLRLK